ncbi:MAG: HEPN domain-containing protein, partial [Candidatus Bathyarchaeia archaeon]
GFREKSHYCLARYVEEKYVNTKRLTRVVVDLLDRFRELRHEDLYELEFSATEEDANEAIENAEIVIEEIEKLIL